MIIFAFFSNLTLIKLDFNPNFVHFFKVCRLNNKVLQLKNLLIACFLFIPFLNFGQANSGLTKQLSLGMNEVYGSYCGIAGQHPQNRILIEGWIEKNNLENIEEWLFSSNVVRQTYAAEAFIRLINQNDLIVTDVILDQIAQLKSSKTLISSCKGCIYGNLTIAELLSDYELE